jgi:sigma-B regulation protein RsbU (phosphoserine phosphatase)
MRILIAEDERITRATLERQLRNWGHDVTATEDGEQAWSRLQETEFDLVISDWEMPRLAGVDLVRRIREAPRGGAYTYVILLTSRSDKSDIVRGIEAGADDYVAKPFDRDELRVRLLAGERIVRLERALSRQNAELREAHERVRFGLRAAARVQQAMLPQKGVVVPRVRTAWRYVPTEELAGDALGLHLIDGRYFVVYLLDVSGHGVPAALLSVSAMHALQPVPESTSPLRDVTHGHDDLGTVRHPARIATALNDSFRRGDTDGRFFTMCLCVLDTATGRCWMTSAGHPPPLLLRGTESIPVPDAGGLPIAMLDDADYDEAALQLHPGDRLCLYSDGFVEQTDATGADPFDDARLLASLRSRATTPIDQLVNDAVDELTAWAGAGPFTDDVSLLIVEWLGSGE